MSAPSRRVIFYAASLIFLLFALPAFASAPTNTPSTIRSIGFESSSDSTTMTPSSGLGTTAFWGRTSSDKHSGASSAWCAATAYPSLLPSGAWPTYLTGTSGDLRVTLPDLADYYSASLTFWYKLPSIGFADTWIVAFGSNLYSNFAPASTWTQQSYNLASRQGTSVVMRFVDKAELPNETPTVGTGPLVDDISVQGFKYGPVRDVTAADAPDAAPLPVAIDRSATDPGCVLLTGNRSAISLSWSRPYQSQSSATADSRPLTYRVWRKTSSQDWIELTEGTPGVSTEQLIDAPAPGDYTYAVQAGDAAGSGYGMYAQHSVTVSGGLNNSTVASVSYRIDGGATQTVNASSALLSGLGDGRTHEITFVVTSTGGAVSRTETLAIALARDGVAPVTNAEVSNANWTSNPVTITLNAQDTGGSSLDSTWYRVGNGLSSKYLGPFSVSSEGETNVYFNSIDRALPPNVEATKSVSVRIDRTAPSAQAVVNGNLSQSVGVSIDATDTLSGVDRIEYEVAGPESLATQASAGRAATTKQFTAVGVYALTYRAFDRAGNSTSGSVSFQVKPYDVSPPVTTASLSAPGWTNAAAVTVTLDANDVGPAGLNSTWYRVGTGGFQRYTGAFQVADVGATTVDFYSIDDAYPQNFEATKSTVVRIDRSSPTATATVVGGGTSKASVLISADDLISGVSSIEYAVSGPSSSATRTVSGSQALTSNFTQSGDYLLTYRATDAAGNTCDGAVTFKVKADSVPTGGGGGGGGGGGTPADTTPPQSALLLSRTGWTSEDVTLTLSAADEDGGSGVAGIVYRLGSAAETTYSGPVVVGAEGQTPVLYHAVDNAGNAEADKAAVIRIDKTAPSAPSAVSYVSLTSSSVSLVWPAAPDTGSGIAGYEVFDGDTKISTVSGTSAIVSGLAPGSSHIFCVVAVDAAGNTSAKAVYALAMPAISDAVVIPAGSSVTATMSVPSLLSTSSSSVASVTIASVTRAGELTIVRSEKPPAEAPSTFKFLGEYYDVSFTGDAAGVITVTLPYDARIPSGRALGLKLQHYTTRGWESLPTTVDVEHHTLTAQLTSLSPIDIAEPASVSSEATISVARSFITDYHKPAVVSAKLKSLSGDYLSGFTLAAQIQKSGVWRTVSTFTAASAAGSYVATIPASDSVKIVRIVLTPNPLYSAKPASAYVRPKVKFSALKFATTAKANVSFRVAGTMWPAHSGQVRVTAYKVYGTSLKAVKTVKVTSKATGSFSAAFALPRGTYRFKASHGTTSVSTEHALTTGSASAKVVVR